VNNENLKSDLIKTSLDQLNSFFSSLPFISPLAEMIFWGCLTYAVIQIAFQARNGDSRWLTSMIYSCIWAVFSLSCISPKFYSSTGIKSLVDPLIPQRVIGFSSSINFGTSRESINSDGFEKVDLNKVSFSEPTQTLDHAIHRFVSHTLENTLSDWFVSEKIDSNNFLYSESLGQQTINLMYYREHCAEVPEGIYRECYNQASRKVSEYKKASGKDITTSHVLSAVIHRDKHVLSTKKIPMQAAILQTGRLNSDVGNIREIDEGQDFSFTSLSDLYEIIKLAPAAGATVLLTDIFQAIFNLLIMFFNLVLSLMFYMITILVFIFFKIIVSFSLIERYRNGVKGSLRTLISTALYPSVVLLILGVQKSMQSMLFKSIEESLATGDITFPVSYALLGYLASATIAVVALFQTPKLTKMLVDLSVEGITNLSTDLLKTSMSMGQMGVTTAAGVTAGVGSIAGAIMTGGTSAIAQGGAAAIGAAGKLAGGIASSFSKGTGGDPDGSPGGDGGPGGLGGPGGGFKPGMGFSGNPFQQPAPQRTRPSEPVDPLIPRGAGGKEGFSARKTYQDVLRERAVAEAKRQLENDAMAGKLKGDDIDVYEKLINGEASEQDLLGYSQKKISSERNKMLLSNLKNLAVGATKFAANTTLAAATGNIDTIPGQLAGAAKGFSAGGLNFKQQAIDISKRVESANIRDIIKNNDRKQKEDELSSGFSIEDKINSLVQDESKFSDSQIEQMAGVLNIETQKDLIEKASQSSERFKKAIEEYKQKKMSLAELDKNLDGKLQESETNGFEELFQDSKIQSSEIEMVLETNKKIKRKKK